MKIKVYPEKTMPCFEERKEETTVAINNESQPEKTNVYTCLPSETNEGPALDSSRAKKIADLKRQIRTGDYQPDLERVAESLLKHIMDDKC